MPKPNGAYWERLARARVHEAQIEIVDALAKSKESMSVVGLTRVIDRPLPNLAYHVRVLKAAGLLHETHTRPVRGSVEHFYVLDQWQA